MKPRQRPPEAYLQLKTATRLLVQRVGGLLAAETVTRVGTSQLADYYHPHKPEIFAPLDVLADLEAVADSPVVTSVLARFTGHHLVAWDVPAAGSCAKAVAAVLKRAGELASLFADAMEDGLLADDEVDRLLAELAEISAAAQAACALLRHRRKGGAA